VTVPAAFAWPSNAHLIADVAKLGYLRPIVLDVTYGKGTFWKIWRPYDLIAHDLKLDGGDFRALPYAAGDAFGTVVFDPPYKLNGTPTPEVDARYGAHEPTRWQDRMALCFDGAAECRRVLAPKGHLLWKCQDQVVSGHVVWQTYEFTEFAVGQLRLKLVDRFDMLGTARPQPMEGRKQEHAHGRPSTLLVFRKP